MEEEGSPVDADPEETGSPPNRLDVSCCLRLSAEVGVPQSSRARSASWASQATCPPWAAAERMHTGFTWPSELFMVGFHTH